MSKKPRGRGSKYTTAFKSQLAAESRASGAMVPMISKRHGVPTSRIYSWRGDARFQTTETDTPRFTAVEVVDAPRQDDLGPFQSPASIEITLENGRNENTGAILRH